MADSRHITNSRSGAITRRALFAGAGATISVAALGSVIAPVLATEEVYGLPLDSKARFEAARAEFMVAAKALYPDIDNWFENVTETGVMMFGSLPPKPVEFTGYGAYEIKIGHVTPIVALAPSESGDGYFYQNYWRNQQGTDRFVGKVKFAKTESVTIVRKIRALT